MPTIDRAGFITRMRGMSLKETDIGLAYPGVDVRGLANAQGFIEGTPGNLEKLWKAIDRFDRDGSAATISGPLPVRIVDWVLTHAIATPVDPPSGGVADADAWRKLAEAGDRAITAKTKAHHDAIDATGVGRYYGDHGSFYAEVRANDRAGVNARIEGWTRRQWTLAAMSRGRVDIRGPNGATATIKESSCIGWVMENAKAAHEAAGMAARFAKIEQRMRDADLRGTVLCEELQKDGWTAVFYSPRTAADLGAAGENEKLAALNMAKAGALIWRASTVEGSRGVECDVVVSGYRDTAPDAATEALLRRLESVPFFIGVANGGMHTFVGHQGNVCDFHWTAGPDEKRAMTEEPVREWAWDTGLYMVPPGFWTGASRDL